MIGKRTLVLAFMLAACVDRQADQDDETALAEPTCMILWASGYWNDGSTWTIQNEWEAVASVCLCMTEAERESGSRLEELNDLGVIECERASKLYFDFDHTDCQEHYENGDWLGGVYVARGESEHYNYRGLTCGDEDDELGGCSIRERELEHDHAPWAVLALVSLLGLRRGRATASSPPNPAQA